LLTQSDFFDTFHSSKEEAETDDASPDAAPCASAARSEPSTGFLDHILPRGLERGQIVADEQNRMAFLARMGDLAAAARTT
jgi:hypothetical protein